MKRILFCVYLAACRGPEEKTPPAPKPTIFKSQGACWFGIMKTQDAGSGYRWCELTSDCKHTEKCP